MNESTLWLRIELLTDVVFTRRGGSVGVHECLDYVPGAALLGAAAARLFTEPGFGPDFFLSGAVRFGDGLPSDDQDCPAWPVPFNYHVEKGASAEHAPVVNALDPAQTEGVQLQQIRDRHLAVDGRRLRFDKRYQLKTAISPTLGNSTSSAQFGRAAEGQLFGYEALPAGESFFAPVCFSEQVSPALRDRLIAALTTPGIRLGRSKSAQYGHVRITRTPSARLPHWPEPEKPITDALVLYLASDLALVNDCGAPTLRPEPSHFGLPSSSVFWGERSFIRTRRYSPWNAFRNLRDTERQVLVRGSVLVFSVPGNLDRAALAMRLHAEGIGLHTAEGLGRVLVDPGFVLRPRDVVVPAPVVSPPSPLGSNQLPAGLENNPLARCIRRRAEADSLARKAAELGEAWKTECLRGRAASFPSRSQWNDVRNVVARESGWLAAFKNHIAREGATAWRPIGDCLVAKCEALHDGPLARAALRETAIRIVRHLQNEKESLRT